MAVHRSVDWGEPQPAEWVGGSEILSVRVPVDVARAVRARARTAGVSVNAMMHRLLATAMYGHKGIDRVAHTDLVSTLFD